MSELLLPHTGILGLRKAKHLLRRATFNYSKNNISEMATMTALEAISFLTYDSDYLLSEPFDYQNDGFWISSNELPNSFSTQDKKRAYVCSWWWYNAVNQFTIKYKLSYFLFTSFTVANNSNSGASTYFFDYLKLLDFYALGNIKTLAKKITKDNAMLEYLNNTDNYANNPNENYAREFLELFTILKGPQIGVDNYTNYTELDVQQAAKVLTGFRKMNDRSIIDEETNLPIGWNDISKHDTSNKVFSDAFDNQEIIGQESEEGMNQELDDFVEMIFNKQETARAYCRKLYRFFIKSEWDNDVESEIIEPLSQQLLNNDYNILPTVNTLLSSKHFFDQADDIDNDEIIGAIVKSPLQLVNEVITFFNISIPDPNTNAEEYYGKFFRKFLHNSYFSSAGMNFFNPDTVAGFPAHYQEPDFDRHWFTSSTIIARYKLIESLITGRNKIFPNANIFTQIDAVTFVNENIQNPSNINDLVIELASFLFPESISEDRIQYFVDVVLEDYEDYYWTGAWNLYINEEDDVIVRTRLNSLITAMINSAEFQLM
tara:strand:+ start:4075 stop:5706 length:1632 start_codon:yes stop_codon:yes gene_type:complete